MDVRWRQFIWDREKEKLVISARGITFKEAALATTDPRSIRGPDEFYSRDEHRQWTVGLSPKKRLLLVISTEQEGQLTRIITAWKATGGDKELYEKTIR
jgi:uncharacterized DUF497 family protein